MRGERVSIGLRVALAIIAATVFASSTWVAAQETLLHSFNNNPTDGQNVEAGVILDPAGNLYGTTAAGGRGGTNCNPTAGCGTVFELTLTAGGGWTEQVLYPFQGGTDGYAPVAGLVRDAAGNLYGTTSAGGVGSGCTECGTVFELNTVSQVVMPLLGSTTSVISSPDPSTAGELVTITATVSPSGPPTPTGTVSFTSNATVISGCTAVPLTSSLTAVCMTSTLAVGTDTIVATYSGDTNYSGSSGTLSQLVNPPPVALQFVRVPPCRVVDTRNPNGTFGGPPIQGGTARSFPLSESDNPCGIPSNAAAYSLNVTVVPSGQLGYLTIWPTGEFQPVVSTMNSLDGRIKANAAIVQAGVNGAVSVYVSNTTNVVLDIDGYFAPSTPSTLQFYALTPCRVLDTRNPDGPLGGPFLTSGQERDFPVQSSNCNIPSSAQAYSMNFTVVPYQGQGSGYLTVWPQGSQKPVVSTLNNLTATIVANAAIVPAGTGGGIAAYSSGNTQLLGDIDGYFAPAGQGGLSLYPIAPCRVLDTRRVGSGQPFQGELTVNVIGSACAPSSTAQAYVFNATVVPPGGFGYLTLWPDGENQPLVSTLNAIDGAITSNMAIVPTNNGSIDAYASSLTQLILDISSYFAPIGTGGGGAPPTYFLSGNWTGTATVTDSGIPSTYTVGASISQTVSSLSATLMVQGEDGANVYTVTGQISGNTVTFSTSTNGIPDGVNVTGTISQNGLQVSGGDSLGTGSGTMTWDGQNTLTGTVTLTEPGSSDTWTSTVTTNGQQLTGSATANTGDSASWSMTSQ